MSLYLTTAELSDRIKYDQRYIREQLKDKKFKKDVHYIKPFGGRKILFIWEEVEKIMRLKKEQQINPMEKILLRKGSANG